jgi:hypothetical protein
MALLYLFIVSIVTENREPMMTTSICIHLIVSEGFRDIYYQILSLLDKFLKLAVDSVIFKSPVAPKSPNTVANGRC